MKHVNMGIDTDPIEDEKTREVVDSMLKSAEREFVNAATWVQDEARGVAERMTKIATQMGKAARFEPWTTGGISTSTERFERWTGRVDHARHECSKAVFFATRLGAVEIKKDGE